MATALAVHMRVHISADDVDDAMVTEIGCVSNFVEQRRQDAGFGLTPVRAERALVPRLTKGGAP